MSRSLFLPLLAVLLLSACSHGHKAPQPEPTDTLQAVVGSVRQASRIYTTRVVVNKIITHEDEARLRGRVLGHDVDMTLPLGERKAAIPVTATLQAYVDLSDFGPRNVRRNGRKIEILLPDPQVEITSTKIDHRHTRLYVSLLRRHFSDAELQDYESQGRDSIVASIPSLGLTDQARANAARVIVPMLTVLGYREEDITITFRDGLSDSDLLRTLRLTPESKQ